VLILPCKNTKLKHIVGWVKAGCCPVIATKTIGKSRFYTKQLYMKALKLILYGLLALTAVYLVVCTFGPKSLDLERSIQIKAAPGKVFPHVADFQQWAAWSPWQKSDPAMVSTFSGSPMSLGHKTDWKSKKEGDGSQEIVEVRPDAYLKTKLVFTQDPENAAYGEWKFEGDSTQTRVTWGFKSGGIPFLARGIVQLMGVEKMMLDYTDQGLADLKKVTEAQ
jgi:hypothetical protein